MGYSAAGAERRYRRSVTRAFDRVPFYREQWAAAGTVLAEPAPTDVTCLPDPPHTLCPFAKPWSGAREPSLWTPDPGPLAAALRIAGCADGAPVLEVRDALLDGARLPRTAWWRRRPGYRIALSERAVVASADRRDAINAAAVAATRGGWVVGGPAELDALPMAGLRPVHRLPLRAAVSATVDGPLVLFEPPLGYLGARSAHCGLPHVDWRRVYARRRDGRLTVSMPGRRRPTVLDMLVPGAEELDIGACPVHGTPVVRGVGGH